MPATLATRVRVLGSGQSNKNDPNDATSVPVAALRHRYLRVVARNNHGEVLRLLVKRNSDLARNGPKPLPGCTRCSPGSSLPACQARSQPVPPRSCWPV